MKRYALIFSLVVGSILVFVGQSYAQLYPERSKIRTGNRHYEKEEYTIAEEYFSRGLALNPDSPEARFNLAAARYKQEMFAEAVETLAPLKADSVDSNIRQKAFFNEGNALFQQRKFEEALESYKNALRINPSDTSAKFNLAYTQKMLENQEGGGGDGGDDQDQDQNQDQNQDNQGDGDQNQDQDQNQDNQDQGDQNQDQDQGEGDQNQDQNQGDQNQDQQDQQGQGQQEAQMSAQEAEQMLQAIQQSEDNTREKVNAEKAKAQTSSTKNW